VGHSKRIRQERELVVAFLDGYEELLEMLYRPSPPGALFPPAMRALPNREQEAEALAHTLDRLVEEIASTSARAGTRLPPTAPHFHPLIDWRRSIGEQVVRSVTPDDVRGYCASLLAELDELNDSGRPGAQEGWFHGRQRR